MIQKKKNIIFTRINNIYNEKKKSTVISKKKNFLSILRIVSTDQMIFVDNEIFLFGFSSSHNKKSYECKLIHFRR
jgi:hypothetical protein